jgi:uncharacterized Zn-binding protein involved in type VI secretion
MHACPMVTVIVPHVGGPIVGPGAPTVLAESLPVAAVGDIVTCTGPPDVIVEGAGTVLAAGRPVAALGAKTAHGGVIVAGAPTVVVGDSSGGFITDSQAKAAKKRSQDTSGQDEAAPNAAQAKPSGKMKESKAKSERPTYTLLIDLEQIDTKYDDDEFTLESEQGEYEQKRTVKADGVDTDGRWLEVTFDKIQPGLNYTCWHDLKKTESGKTAKVLLFEGMHIGYADLDEPDRDPTKDQKLDLLDSLALGLEDDTEEESESESEEPTEAPNAFKPQLRDDFNADGDAEFASAVEDLEDVPSSFWLGYESDPDEFTMPSGIPASLKKEIDEIEAEVERKLKEQEEKDS